MQNEDSEEAAHERLHVQEDSSLRGGDLGHSPIPEEGGGGGAQDSAGGEGHPRFEGDVGQWQHSITKGNPGDEHQGSKAKAKGGDDDGAVAFDELLVEQDPEESDDQ